MTDAEKIFDAEAVSKNLYESFEKNRIDFESNNLKRSRAMIFNRIQLQENFRFVMSALLCAVVCLFASTVAAQPSKVKKLHMMYLVTAKADDLKPGSVVAVEPAFFTDGNEIVFAYDYCEALHLESSHPRYLEPKALRENIRKRTGTWRERVDEWCFRSDVNISVNGLLGVDNTGTEIRFQNVTLVGDPEQMGRGKLASVKETEVSTSIPTQYRRYRFFLAADGTDLLKSIVPYIQLKEDEGRALLAKLDAIKNEYPGTIHLRCAASDCPTGWMDVSKVPHYGSIPADVISTIFVRTGQAGNLSLVSGLRASRVPKSSGSGYDSVLWQGITYVEAQAPPWVRGNEMSLHSSMRENSFGFWAFLYTPKNFVRIGKCDYVLTGTDYFEKTMDLFAFPEASEGCKHRWAMKTPSKH